MSDPRYAHEWRPRKGDGLCKAVVDGKICHLTEEAEPHHRWWKMEQEALPSEFDLEGRLLIAERALELLPGSDKDKQEALDLALDELIAEGKVKP